MIFAWSPMRGSLVFAAALFLTAVPLHAAEDGAPTPISGPREMFSLYGFDDSYFAKLPDSTPLTDDQTEPILRGLYALRRFSREELTRWRHAPSELASWLAGEPSHAGEIIILRGRLKRATRIRPVDEVARRFEMPVYYRCELEIASPACTATVFALSVPRDWLSDAEESRESNERCGCAAVFLKRRSADASQPAPVFLAQRMAWYPEQGNFASLGSLGFDAGLIDGVEDKVALSQSSDLEREAFYQLLDAVGRTGPGELQAVATSELRLAAQLWRAELKRQRGQPDASPTAVAELERKLDRAQVDADDVAPLFNTPAESRGKLITLLGAARRAIEIRVEDADIRARFGLDHYFEIELITPDSRGNPVAFCLRELPPGMPLGEEIYEPVRVTGFFLKTWGFRTAQSTNAAPGTVRRQLAPLLIGRDLAWMPVATEKEENRGLIVGAVVAVLALVFGIAWWLNRDSRRRTKALPDQIQLP